MARQSNAEYWYRRMKLMQEALLDKSYAYVENLERQFQIAQSEIEKKMAVWYQRFAANNDISLAEAKRLLTTRELEEFRWSVEEYIAHGEQNALDGQWKKQLENASARVHISRLETLKLELQQQAEVLYGNTLDAVDSAVRMIYEESYYRTAFEIQKFLGVGWTMHGIDERRMEKVLLRPWTADGKTFSDRIWTNHQSLVNTLNTRLTQMVIQGEAPDRAIKEIAKQFNVSKRKAGRLVMTESAAFSASGRKECYEELDVERYRVVATFDKLTCELCGAMDGQVFKMSEYRIGVTANPFHPSCRCDTAPYFEDMEGIGQRFARDVETGEGYYVPADMTYEQWKAEQDARHGVGSVDRARKAAYNESRDKDQLSRYQEVLGHSGDLKSILAFQKLKYSDLDGYADLKAWYRYKQRVPEATREDFVTYKAVKETGVIGRIRIPPEPIDINQTDFKDEHAKRHGCTLEDARNYIGKAKCSITRERWDGKSINYYADDGAAYIDAETKEIKTAFARRDFDTKTKKVAEVLK